MEIQIALAVTARAIEHAGNKPLSDQGSFLIALWVPGLVTAIRQARGEEPSTYMAIGHNNATQARQNGIVLKKW